MKQYQEEFINISEVATVPESSSKELHLWVAVVCNAISDLRSSNTTHRRKAQTWIKEASLERSGFGWICLFFNIDPHRTARHILAKNTYL